MRPSEQTIWPKSRPALTEEQKRDKTKELVQLLKEGQKTEISDKEAEKLKDQKKHTVDKKTTN